MDLVSWGYLLIDNFDLRKGKYFWWSDNQEIDQSRNDPTGCRNFGELYRKLLSFLLIHKNLEENTFRSFHLKVLITFAMFWEGKLCQWILWPQCTENFDSGATGPLMVCSHRMRYCGFPNRMRYYGRDRVLMKRSSSLTSRRSRDARSGRDACAVRCQGWTGSWTSGIREEQGQSFILVCSLEYDVCLYKYLYWVRCNLQ